MTTPSTLAINAWTGHSGANEGPLASGARVWGARVRGVRLPFRLAAPPLVDPADWRHPNVGWGVVLPENEALASSDRAEGVDAPEPIKELLLARSRAPVLRYRADSNFQTLRRYYADGAPQDLEITSATKRGTGRGELPQYLLLCGTPVDIPWELQYVLSGPCFVGRLDLDNMGLRRYVDALISGFANDPAAPNERVVWATDHGPDDITRLMRTVIAEPLAKMLRDDDDIGPTRVHEFFGGAATISGLQNALVAHRPALVVTASHGMTGPVDDVPAMRQQLGNLVDDQRALLNSSLLNEWRPGGCIWYAHACCSGGSSAQTQYDGLMPPGSALADTLNAISACGAMVAPFPKALLSAESPARAFIGHVEPTFNWTLRAPETGQVLTRSLIEALYTRMHQLPPLAVGLALDPWYRHVGELQTRAQAARGRFTEADPVIREKARTDALRSELAALDRGSMVILGDPTACLPPLR